MESEMSILGLILEASLVVKLVILLLVAASIASWAIAFYKMKEYSLLRKNNEDFLTQFREMNSIYEFEDIAEIKSESNLRPIFISTYQEFYKIYDMYQKKGLRTHFSEFGLGSLERTIQNGVGTETMKARNGLTTLASIGSITPFVGLFGTVWGIINSFQGLALGGGSIQSVAPGIAEALVATAIGLAAAIPAVWFFNKFNSETSNLSSEMDSFGQELLNLVERSLQDE